jgi:hypothetical protein
MIPTKATTVHTSSFTVKGRGMPGQFVRVGNQTIPIPQSGQFSLNLSLYPGINHIGIATTSKDKQVLQVFYVKQYQDLPSDGMFTPFFQKIGTLGYFPTGLRFEPSKVLTKREFYQSLNKAGYRNKGDLEPKGSLDKRMSYKQAVDVMQKITGRTLSKDTSAAGDLTRRMFALLLYELPSVKANMTKKFPDNP